MYHINTTVRLVGSTSAGRLSDYMVISWRKRRGFWCPEDRLRATTFGGVVLAPMSIIGSGIVTQFCDATTGMMVLNFFCLFLNGVGVSLSAILQLFLFYYCC